MALAPACPRSPHIDFRRAAVCLRGADRGVQSSGHPRPRGCRRRRGPIRQLTHLRGTRGRVSQSQHRRTPRRSRVRRPCDRAGKAIAAVYLPTDFERDLKAGRRPQVVAFYNQQFLTAAGVALSGLSDSLGSAVDSAAAAARGAPQASRIGSLVAETIVLVNPARNYAQFLLRALLPMVLHVVIALSAGYSVGSEFHRRSMRTWLACAGGNPIIALAGKLAPL